jgi:hypothetical protein
MEAQKRSGRRPVGGIARSALGAGDPSTPSKARGPTNTQIPIVVR